MDYFITPQIVNFFIVTIVCIFIYTGLNRYINMAVEKLDECNKKNLEGTLKGLSQFFVFAIYFFYILNYFMDVKLCVAILFLFAVSGLFVFKDYLNSLVLGYFRVINKVIVQDESVVLNNKHLGVVKKVSLSSIEIIKNNDTTLVIPHSEVNLIEKNFKDYCNVNASVVLSYRENPEKAEEVLIKLTEKLNDKFKDYLLGDSKEEVISSFIYKGITNLNADYQGIEYSISVRVKVSVAEEIRQKLEREVAICCYKNGLKQPEQNIFSEISTK
mgnify:CR=1 FL=1